MNILLAVIALSFLILVHEVGHFIAARKAGVKVQEFSIFMGPKIYSWQKGETKYSIRAIPMGGFVKMEGEEEASDDERAFSKKPAWKRAVIIASGALMNILIAVIIMTVISFSMGYNTRSIAKLDDDSPLANAGIKAGDKIVSFDGKHIFHPNDLSVLLYVSDGSPTEIAYRREGEKGIIRTFVTPKKTTPIYLIGIVVENPEGKGSNVIQRVEKGSPAEKAGLIPGDILKKVDDVEIAERSDLSVYLQKTKDKPVNITIDRNGDIIEIHDVVPYATQTFYDLGVWFEYKKGDFFGSIASGINNSISTIRSVFYTLGWLFTGKATFRDISGPVGIVAYIGDVVDMGTGFTEKLLYLLQITAFLSLNLGVMNLLPFPALDGGKLVVILIEKIRRKPLDPEKEAWISMVGFFLLMLLLIATLVNDIPRLITR
ncbi:MAG: RIP metalloprotease RseP [Clostridiaceae bacterium]|jgi:regulator of sigma E protease|nr:RIP metalloprotease RseP [Clostridiaceae bacterium]